MIFFGTRAQAVTGDIVNGIQCPNCGHGQFRAGGLQHYFHLYWIPTFPFGRTLSLSCTNCRHELDADGVPAEMASQLLAGVFAGRSRVPMFAGLILISLLMLFSGYSLQQAGDERADRLDSPAAGDYYIVDQTRVYDDADDRYRYAIWLLSEVTDEHLQFKVSGSAYTLSTGAKRDIRDGTAASEIPDDQEGLFIEPEQMASLRAAGAFRAVERR
jgi:hypothetical protein